MSFRSALLLSAASLALLSGAAQAADLLVSAAPEQAAASSNWDGFYAGMFAGYAAGDLTTTDNFLPTSPFEAEYAGYLVGVQAGYNFHLNDNVVGGYSVDIAYNSASSDNSSYDIALDWSGSVTSRLGLDLNGFVPYVLGGITATTASVTDFPAATESQTHIGYTVGAGIEVALADSVSANVEYRYTGYGTKIYSLTNITTADFVDHSVRAGLNYHFN